MKRLLFVPWLLGNVRGSRDAMQTLGFGGNKSGAWMLEDWHQFWPGYYECEGGSWDPRWSVVKGLLMGRLERPIWRPDFFHDYATAKLWATCSSLITEHANTMIRMLESGASLGGWSSRGAFDSDDVSFRLAQTFFNLLRHRAGHLEAEREISDSGAFLDNFCLFGYINCLVVGAATVISAPQLAQQHWNMNETVGAENPGEESFEMLAEHYLRSSLVLLTRDGAFDMIEASLWPIRSLDVRVMLWNYLREPQRRELVLYDRVAALQGDPRQPHGAAQVLARDYWPIFQDWRRSQPALQAPPTVSVLVFGLHGSLKMEPTASLKAALPNVDFEAEILGTDCRLDEPFRAYSCRLLCSLQNRCDPQRPAEGISRLIGEDILGRAMAEVINTMRIDEILYQKAVASFDATATAMLQTKANFDLFICAEGLFCSLFRKHLALTPFLLYIGHLLITPNALAASQLELLKAFQADINSNLAAGAVNHLGTALCAFYSAGVRLPWVRVQAMYLGDLRYNPRHQKDILFPRTEFYRSFNGKHFQVCFQRMLAWHELEWFAINSTFVGIDDFVEFHDMMQFLAVVLIPRTDALMSFDELYSSGVPIFLPNKEFMVRVLLSNYYKIHDRQAFNPLIRTPEARDMDSRGIFLPYLPLKPFTQGKPGWEEDSDFRVLYFWYDMSTYALYPHTREFDSVCDLITLLLQLTEASARTTSMKMLEEVARARREALAWYRSAFSNLMLQRRPDWSDKR